MSGIAGILSTKEQELVNKMLDKISHRGDTQAEIWTGSNAALGAVRLTKINERPGPAQTLSGNRASVMDGWLTNRQFLLDQLTLHQMNSETDVEIAMHSYEEFGTRFIGRIKGEFALAIVDGDRLLLGRDRLGIRPLYYGFYQGALCFSSEMKALVGIVDKLHEFPPGFFLLSDQGLYPYQPYFPEPVQLNGAMESAERLGNYLKGAVQRAIPSDAAVGVWLSGGVDSSVIAALARPFVDELHTFSVGTAGAPDLKYARQVAQYIGAIHHERIYDLEDMYAVLEKVIYHLESFDAPLVNSAISNYLVSQLAAEYVPFVLSGEGGDELFAGYAYQKEYYSDVELTLSVQDAIQALHNTALQRVDRSAAAFTCGVATPFLDPDVVRYALAIPSRWKIRGDEPTDKWPLRQGLADSLPADVIWRDKSKFWEGSGSGNTMAKFAEKEISDEVFDSQRNLGNAGELNSKEDLLYFQIFRKFFDDSIPLTELGRTEYI